MGVPQIQRTKLCSGEGEAHKYIWKYNVKQCDTNKNIGKYGDTVRKKYQCICAASGERGGP